MAAGQIALAALILLPPALATKDLAALRPGPVEILSLLALGVASSGLAYVLYYRLIAAAGAVIASLATYLMPPVGVTLGWLVLGELVGWRLLVGIVLILLGMAVVQGRASRSAWRGGTARASTLLADD